MEESSGQGNALKVKVGSCRRATKVKVEKSDVGSNPKGVRSGENGMKAVKNGGDENRNTNQYANRRQNVRSVMDLKSR